MVSAILATYLLYIRRIWKLSYPIQRSVTVLRRLNRHVCFPAGYLCLLVPVSNPCRQSGMNGGGTTTPPTPPVQQTFVFANFSRYPQNKISFESANTVWRPPLNTHSVHYLSLPLCQNVHHHLPLPHPTTPHDPRRSTPLPPQRLNPPLGRPPDLPLRAPHPTRPPTDRLSHRTIPHPPTLRQRLRILLPERCQR